MTLDEIRRNIDEIDSQIIGLLARRSTFVAAAGKLKKDEQAVRDPKRVEQVIARARARASETSLDPDIAEKIYRTIVSCFIDKELRDFNDARAAVSVYTRADLRLRSAVPGAMMWAIGLEKSMLTYFEMQPNTQFPEHSHEAEQITLVLEGELTFTFNNTIRTLRSGDVVAIPSNVKHAVRSGPALCKAVDAWSPVRQEYLAQ